MKLKICLLAALCLFLRVSGQDKASNNALKVGDEFQDVTFDNVLNYPSKGLNTGEFKDRFIIFDFWATWCTSCINHFPELYAIQQKLRDQVKVILVNCKGYRDTESQIRTFLDKRKDLYQFPCIVNDTLLARRFPHNSIPHYVIVHNNKVIAITDAESMTEGNLRKLISLPQYSLYHREEEKLDKRKPFFTDGNGTVPANSMYRSTLTGFLRNINGGWGFRTTENGLETGIYNINTNLEGLYKTAYPDFARFPKERVLYGPVKFDGNDLDSIAMNDVQGMKVTYESVFPPTSHAKALAIMQADLKRYFNLKVDSVYRDTICYVLKLKKDKNLKRASGKTVKETNIDEDNNAPKYLSGFPISYLARELQNIYNTPYYDETGCSDLVDLKLPAQLDNITDLSLSLSAQGIELLKVKRRISYMYLSQSPIN